jgi:heme-degrading monooxygenase HmoA
MSALAGTIARTPDPPYYAVIFTSLRSDGDAEGYTRAAEELEALARDQPGFLGIESARDASGAGITVSYWASEEAIFAWKRVAEHRAAQRKGRAGWYVDYTVRVARVERAYTLASSGTAGL